MAIYEPSDNRPAYPLPLAFGPYRHERRVLAKALARWAQRDLQDLLLRIYADDMSLVG